MKAKMMAAALVYLMLLALAGCGGSGNTDMGNWPGHGSEAAPTPSQPPDSEGLGDLQSLEYNYGSFFGGEWNFSITADAAGQYRFTAIGYNGVDLDVQGTVGQSQMDAIAAIIADHDIASWNGFDQRDEEILDGYGFTLVADFEQGSLAASGYEKYPENYDQGHAALSDYLNKLAENLTTGSTAGCIPLLEYLNNPAINALDANFDTDFSQSVSVLYQNVGGGACR